MSGVPKRSHDEGNQSSQSQLPQSKYQAHDDPPPAMSYPKLSPSLPAGPADFHPVPPYDMPMVQPQPPPLPMPKMARPDRSPLPDARDSDANPDPKGDAPLNWKDHARAKRYSDAAPEQQQQQHPAWVGKDDDPDAHEAVGENKYDDKFKEKDRKRKEAKHREWGEKERRSVGQAGNSGAAEGKDSAKEERDGERWERERKEAPPKDKERVKEIARRDSPWNGVDKDSINNDKDLQDQETFVPEKKPKEAVERERRKDRDGADGVGERPEKRIRGPDKEPDADGCADADVAMEREREVHNYGVQQRKRMQRSRGSPQVANCEPRFRNRIQDNEGSQGKSEVSSVIYKVGECMQDLIKLWKEYEASQAEKSGESSNTGPTLEIRIPADHVTATNRQVRGGQLWGTDIYTDDSDLVAVLMHTGYCRPTASPPPPAIQELRTTIRVLPPQDCYISTLRNNVRSRAWGAAIGCSYRVERCCIVKKGGGTIDLEPCLTLSSTVEPTLAPVAVERTMTTRAAASNALRQQRFVREVTIQYNLCNEPWIKYSISIVADKGLKKPLYTCARLKKGEVLYLETHSCRYELCFSGEKMMKAVQPCNNNTQDGAEQEKVGSKSENEVTDIFRWSRCKMPLPQKVMRSIGIPLPTEHVEVLEENLDWEDVQWSQTGVWISGKEYTLARVHFLSNN